MHQYCLVFGQKVNDAKSKVFFCNCSPKFSAKVQNILGFKWASLPCKYLGIPLFAGVNKASYWNPIILTIKNRIASWKNSWLSLPGRILLIKSVLSSIPNYMMYVLPMPSKVKSDLEATLKSFLWKGNRNKKTRST